jgi:hypothetical protein
MPIVACEQSGDPIQQNDSNQINNFFFFFLNQFNDSNDG